MILYVAVALFRDVLFLCACEDMYIYIYIYISVCMYAHVD